jgi:molybdenum cofactor cytidylyltransferase
LKTEHAAFGVVILAAGSSLRMRRPKLLLPWGETSVIGHQISVWNSLGVGQIAVVHKCEDREMLRELDRLGFLKKNRIPNPRSDEGMFSSVRSAAEWNNWNLSLTHWVMSLGDQPHLKSETLRALLRLSEARPDIVCQPQYEGRARHPVVMPAFVFRQLRGAKASSLKEFLAKFGIATVDVADPGLDCDIDEPKDYQKALALCGLGNPIR